MKLHEYPSEFKELISIVAAEKHLDTFVGINEILQTIDE